LESSFSSINDVPGRELPMADLYDADVRGWSER